MYGQGNYPPQFRAPPLPNFHPEPPPQPPQQIHPGPPSHPPQYQYNIPPPQQPNLPSLHSSLPPPPPCPSHQPLPPPPSIQILPPPPSLPPLPPPPPYPHASTLNVMPRPELYTTPPLPHLIHVRAPTPPFSSSFVSVSPVPPPSCVPPPPPSCAPPPFCPQPPPPSCAPPVPPPPPPSSPSPPPPQPPFSPDDTQETDTASADTSKVVSDDSKSGKPENWDNIPLPRSNDEVMVYNIEADKEGAMTSLNASGMDMEDGAGQFDQEEANNSLSKKSPGESISAGNENDGSKEAFPATTAAASEQLTPKIVAVLHDAEDVKDSLKNTSPNIASSNTAGPANENPFCLLQGYASDESEEDADRTSPMKIVDFKSNKTDSNQPFPLDNCPKNASMVDETSKCELSQKNVDRFGKHHKEEESANQTSSDGQLRKKGVNDGDYEEDRLDGRHMKRERDGCCSPRREKQIRFNSLSPRKHSLHPEDIIPASLSQPSASPNPFQQIPPPLHHFPSLPPNNILPLRPYITSDFHSPRYTVPPPPPPRHINSMLHSTAPHGATLQPHMPLQQPPFNVDEHNRPLPVTKHLDPPFGGDDRNRYHLQNKYLGPPMKDLPFSHHLPPYGLGDRISSSFLEYRATHYNPFASTFEQVPSTSKFDSSRFNVDNVLKGGPELKLTSLRDSNLSVNNPIASDAYDPLLDSVEPPPSVKIEPVIGSSQKSKDDEDKSSKQHKSEEDENDEVAIDAEVGVVENASPQYVNESQENQKVDIGNTVDQMEKSIKGKDSRSMKLFKNALADFVKEVLKPSWKHGTISKEAFKTIVRKTVEKVSAGLPSHQIPKSQAKINQFIESSQRKITKLVMGYVDKYVKL